MNERQEEIMEEWRAKMRDIDMAEACDKLVIKIEAYLVAEGFPAIAEDIRARFGSTSVDRVA